MYLLAQLALCRSFCFCLFGLRLYVPVNNFSVMSGRSRSFNLQLKCTTSLGSTVGYLLQHWEVLDLTLLVALRLVLRFGVGIELVASVLLYEPRRKKTGFLHMQKQRCSSASR